MSAFSDALKALKKVVLIEEHITRLQQDLGGLADDIRRTRDYAAEIDKRVVRIETMIEMSSRQPSQKRIEE